MHDVNDSSTPSSSNLYRRHISTVATSTTELERQQQNQQQQQQQPPPSRHKKPSSPLSPLERHYYTNSKNVTVDDERLLLLGSSLGDLSQSSQHSRSRRRRYEQNDNTITKLLRSTIRSFVRRLLLRNHQDPNHHRIVLYFIVFVWMILFIISVIVSYLFHNRKYYSQNIDNHHNNHNHINNSIIRNLHNRHHEMLYSLLKNVSSQHRKMTVYMTASHSSSSSLLSTRLSLRLNRIMDMNITITDDNSDEPDYNHLYIRFCHFQKNNPLDCLRYHPRTIRVLDEMLYDKERDHYLNYIDLKNSEKPTYNEEREADDDYYLHRFDDMDLTLKTSRDPEHDKHDACIRFSWTFEPKSICNQFHEILDVMKIPVIDDDDDADHHPDDRDFDEQPYRNIKYLGSGFYRDTFLFVEQEEDPNYHHPIEFVLKVSRMINVFDQRMVAKIETEAIIFEQLSASPSISNIYGYCGGSIIGEAAVDITEDIVPDYTKKNKNHNNSSSSINDNDNKPYYAQYFMERGKLKHHNLQKIEEQHGNNVHPFNNYTAEEKLHLAISMAESIAEMHGHIRGVIVNDDVHPDQYLRSKYDNPPRIILNDMNNAVFLEWNYMTNQYCRYRCKYGGDFRAPEEFIEPDGSFVDESVDIWPMGNTIYTLLTGLFPYYHSMLEWKNQRLAIRGITPFIDPRYSKRSYIEYRLVRIMNLCHTVNAKKRPTIFDVVAYLKETKMIWNNFTHYENFHHPSIVKFYRHQQNEDDDEEEEHEEEAEQHDDETERHNINDNEESESEDGDAKHQENEEENSLRDDNESKEENLEQQDEEEQNREQPENEGKQQDKEHEQEIEESEEEKEFRMI